MNLEPQRFFIGLIDFFSILLPGALITYLLKDAAGPYILGNGYASLEDAEGWAVFLFASYLLGHFIFLIGSWLDKFYDLLRDKWSSAGQIKKMVNKKPLSPSLARWFAGLFFGIDVERPVRQAVAIKEQYLKPLEASSAINAFQWCKARLTLSHLEALATVQHFEADSKFFRSLLVVLVLLIPWGLLTHRTSIAVACLPVLGLAFWRYVDQRLKATNQAYWYVITLEGDKDSTHRPVVNEEERKWSHAGGVVFRQTGKQVEYLLVQTKKAPHEWVLPKGHIEYGEPMPETAVREVKEETGVWANMRAELEGIQYTFDGRLIKAKYYLMEFLEEGRPSDQNRKHKWVPLEEALSLAAHSQIQTVLNWAEAKRTARFPPSPKPLESHHDQSTTPRT
jgi:8-oxo-dGTP pyrophosphatase MutT (NUDIX family)